MPPSFTSAPGLVGPPHARYEVWVADDEDPRVKLIVALGSKNSIRRLVRLRVRQLQSNPFENILPGDPDAGGDGPVLNPPAGLECLGILHLTGNKTYYLGNPDGSPATLCYSGILADGQARLVLLSPVSLWVLGDIYLSGGSALNVAADGGDRVGGDPLDLLIWVPGQWAVEIDLSGNTRFHGGIYAPGSAVTIAGTADMEGAMVVGGISVTGDATLDEVYSYHDPMARIPWPEGAQLDYGPVLYESGAL